MNTAAKPVTRSGNTLLETALILVPLLAVLLATVDFALAIFVRATLQHAVREGVRYAVTYETLPGLGHDASIKQIVQKHALGLLNGRDELIHVRYYDPVHLEEVPENSPGNVIEVSVEGYQWRWLVPLLRSGGVIEIHAWASDRMEGLPGGRNPPPR